MRKALVDEISKTTKIKKLDLIEKDIIIHEILTDLSHDSFFSKNFLFKGGTCLVKAFVGYLRFSEDIDFTWKNQKVFEDKSSKALRKELSSQIDEIGRKFENISSTRNLNFKCQKNNTEYVELGGNDKTCTFKIWYNSELSNSKSFIKVQINFVEKLFYPPNTMKLQSLGTKNNKELKAIFSQQNEYLNPVDFDTYDIKEILCEKIRAILTRQATKARDFLDVYLICTQLKIELSTIEKNAVEKLEFSLNLYEKYRDNLKEKIKLINSGKLFDWGGEKYLLLENVDEEKFYKFIETLETFLKSIIQKINSH